MTQGPQQWVASVGQHLVVAMRPNHHTFMKGTLLVAGIGNPLEYALTRHNAGHLMVDLLAREGRFAPFKPVQYGEVARPLDPHGAMANVLLFKSTKYYMNVQGTPVSKTFAQYKRRGVERLVVVHDDLQVPLGHIKFRAPGSSARGHNGLRDITAQMGSNYSKISVGIGKGLDVVKYVLGKMTEDEQSAIEEGVHEVYAIIKRLAAEERAKAGQ